MGRFGPLSHLSRDRTSGNFSVPLSGPNALQDAPPPPGEPFPPAAPPGLGRGPSDPLDLTRSSESLLSLLTCLAQGRFWGWAF